MDLKVWIIPVLGSAIWGQALKFEPAAVLGPEIPDFQVPRPPVLADFNGDGIPDLVVGSSGSVWLFLSVGGGRFCPPRALGAFGPYAAADLNGDGYADIVLGGDSTRVLFGAGDGTFPTVTEIGPSSQTVHIADLNHDGKPDIVLRAGDSLFAYLGNGDGSFQTPTETVLSADTYGSLIGDFNGDGIPDVLLPPPDTQMPPPFQHPSASTRFEILLGQGDGSFVRRATSLSFNGNATGATVVGDFNGDKISDVAFGGNMIALGNGDGDFGQPIAVAYGDLTAVADLNGDDILDLFVTKPYDPYYYDGYTAVMFGNGDGTFGDPKPIMAGRPVDSGEMAILDAADLDGDGVMDLVAGSWWKNSIRDIFGGDGLWALLGDADGTFPRAQKIGGVVFFGAVAAADFNGDGNRDLAVSDFGGAVIRLYIGRGDGSFEPVRNYDVGLPPAAITGRDFNGDGAADLAVLTAPGPLKASIPLLFGAPDGFAEQPGAVALPEPVFIGALLNADLNGDGRGDLVGAAPELWSGLSNGDGTFRQTRYGLEGAPRISGPLLTAFVDGDSYEDLLAVGPGGSNGQELFVLLSKGDGTFRRVPSFSFYGGIYGIAAADFTGDGILDVVVTNLFGMYFLRGHGDGAFDPPAAFVSQGNQPDQQYAAYSADFNGDGKTDLLTCGAFCSIRLGNGDGTFQSPQRLDFGKAGSGFLLADFDNDGLIDIAVGDSGKIELFLNRSQ
ncbi:MAG TPA: VCBS repeat-containing protein [Bryobacteraceae bacterium]|jgi:hypothetical protein